jgi:hypothetical protein
MYITNCESRKVEDRNSCAKPKVKLKTVCSSFIGIEDFNSLPESKRLYRNKSKNMTRTPTSYVKQKWGKADEDHVYKMWARIDPRETAMNLVRGFD